jgi:hypothetical protein
MPPDIVYILRDDADALERMAKTVKGLGQRRTMVRVRKPELLISALRAAADEIEALRKAASRSATEGLGCAASGSEVVRPVR